MNELDREIKDAAVSIGLQTGVSAEELATALNCMEPCIQETKPEHKLCFNRPRIVHQVNNRKPRNVIKKIIR